MRDRPGDRHATVRPQTPARPAQRTDRPRTRGAGAHRRRPFEQLDRDEALPFAQDDRVTHLSDLCEARPPRLARRASPRPRRPHVPAVDLTARTTATPAAPRRGTGTP